MLKPMIALAGLAGALAAAGAALAQVPPAEIGARNVPAPWWMATPVIASIGRVRTELPANRASFTANFIEVDKTVAAGTTKAAARVNDLTKALRAIGAERIRVNTTFAAEALYEQYRDKDGNLQTNRRDDKIERYSVDATVRVDVTDTRVLEAAYAAVVNAVPSRTSPVTFSLVPDNATNSWLASEAIKDAARRARLAAEATGARLGAVKVIDPTGRACQTDVLAGWPSYANRGGAPMQVDGPPQAGSDSFGIAAGGGMGAKAAAASPLVQVSLQPPLEERTDEACVVYALLP